MQEETLKKIVCDIQHQKTEKQTVELKLKLPDKPKSSRQRFVRA